MSIEGVSSAMTLEEKDGRLVFSVPMSTVDSGIALRDDHMNKNYVQIDQFPNVVLDLAKADVQWPAEGSASASAAANVTFHGVTQPTTVTYTVNKTKTGWRVKGRFEYDVSKHGITIEPYMGISFDHKMYADRDGGSGGCALTFGRPRPLLGALAVVVTAFTPDTAFAYPWMIHHGYTSCGQCHVDPSGAGTLSDYGRAQSEILLRTPLEGGRRRREPRQGSRTSWFGAVPLPETVELQADVRGLLIPDPANLQAILMQSDLRGAVVTKSFAVSASIGGVSRARGAGVALLGATWNLVSREYWAAVMPSKAVTVRAGRMNLPFGLRTEDHILDVRGATRTTINDEQQTGASLFWNNRKWRAELMGIAGNLQVRPDSFRDRGYSGYIAFAPETTFEVGLSSLFTTARTDLETLAPRRRMAEGVFARWGAGGARGADGRGRRAGRRVRRRLGAGPRHHGRRRLGARAGAAPAGHRRAV
jgi:hypothetical protein